MAAPAGPAIIAEIHKFLGDQYVWGGTGPTTFDCSGLIYYALGRLGVKGVPRTSEAQYGWVKHIAASDLQPGDLVFSQWPGDEASPGHVAVYAGGGNLIEAGSPATGVHQTPLDTAYKAHVVGYGRVPGTAASGAPGGGGGGGLLSLFLPSGVTGFFSDAEQLVSGAMWFLNPENWMRIISGFFGVLLAGAGIVFMVKAGA